MVSEESQTPTDHTGPSKQTADHAGPSKQTADHTGPSKQTADHTGPSKQTADHTGSSKQTATLDKQIGKYDLMTVLPPHPTCSNYIGSLIKYVTMHNDICCGVVTRAKFII